MILNLFNRDNGMLLATFMTDDKTHKGEVIFIDVEGKLIGIEPKDEFIEDVQVEVVECSEVFNVSSIELQIAFVKVIKEE